MTGTPTALPRLKRCMRTIFTALAAASTLVAAACAPQAGPVQQVPTVDPTSLPTILHDRSSLAMEALVSGKLTRRGSCLYLEHAPDRFALIFWGDDEVRIAALDVGGWILNNYTTGERLFEGDMIGGAGGFFPENADLARIAGTSLPSGCAGPAVQLYEVRKLDR